MSSEIFLAFIGPQGSGKTTMARHVIEHAREFKGADVAVRLSFADALRREVMDILKAQGIFPNYANPDLLIEPKYKARYRPLLQVWGTEIRRSLEEDYWARRASEVIENVKAEGWTYPIIVIDDCRFRNEYEMLRRHKFTFVRLEANPDIPTVNPEHPSELDWPHFEFDLYLPWRPTEVRFEILRAHIDGSRVYED